MSQIGVTGVPDCHRFHPPRNPRHGPAHDNTFRILESLLCFLPPAQTQFKQTVDIDKCGY